MIVYPEGLSLPCCSSQPWQFILGVGSSSDALWGVLKGWKWFRITHFGRIFPIWLRKGFSSLWMDASRLSPTKGFKGLLESRGDIIQQLQEWIFKIVLYSERSFAFLSTLYLMGKHGFEVGITSESCVLSMRGCKQDLISIIIIFGVVLEINTEGIVISQIF